MKHTDIKMKLNKTPEVKIFASLYIDDIIDTTIDVKNKILIFSFDKSLVKNKVSVSLYTHDCNIRDNPVTVKEIILDNFYKHPKFLLGKCDQDISDTLYSSEKSLTFYFKWPFFRHHYII